MSRITTTSGKHGEVPLGQIHPTPNWSFADLVARDAKVDFIVEDVGSDCQVGDDIAGWTFYKISKVVTGVATWISISGGGGSSLVGFTTVDNTALGVGALTSNTNGSNNSASGAYALYSNTNGSNNSASGVNALYYNTNGSNNSASGVNALYYNTAGYSNSASGAYALFSNTAGCNNSASGAYALVSNTIGYENVALGHNALYYNTTGYENVAVGCSALFYNSGGYRNTAVGSNALNSNAGGVNNTALGYDALALNNTGVQNTAVGGSALGLNDTGIQNTAVGMAALGSNTSGTKNTAVGGYALYGNLGYDNCSGLGYGSNITASNQVQLGDSTTTTYAYGAVQNRSDIRDKTDIRDITLGLEFVNRLHPVDAKWDMREDYRVPPPDKPVYPDKPSYPDKPVTIQTTQQVKKLNEVDPNIPADYTIEGDLVVFFVQGIKVRLSLSTYIDCFELKEVFENEDDGIAWQESYKAIDDAYVDACKAIDDAYEVASIAWAEASKMANIIHDGTHKRNRYHHFLIAQEVKEVMDEMGVDFAGYQDHKIGGGDDVLSIGYSELIPVLIKAIQEQQVLINALKIRVDTITL